MAKFAAAQICDFYADPPSLSHGCPRHQACVLLITNPGKILWKYTIFGMVAKRMQKAQIANVLLKDIFHRQDQKVGYSCCSFGIREDITTAPILVSDWFFPVDPLINEKAQLLISWSMKVASILKSTCCWVVPSARSRYRLPPWFVKVASTHRGPSCQQTNKHASMDASFSSGS